MKNISRVARTLSSQETTQHNNKNYNKRQQLRGSFGCLRLLSFSLAAPLPRLLLAAHFALCLGSKLDISVQCPVNLHGYLQATLPWEFKSALTSYVSRRFSQPYSRIVMDYMITIEVITHVQRSFRSLVPLDSDRSLLVNVNAL